MRTIDHWIGGKPWRGRHTRTSVVWNPATGDQQATVALGDANDVEYAVATAARSFESWSQSSLSQRTKILFGFRERFAAHAREFAEVISDEHGKVLADAEGEVQRGLEVVEFACGIPTLLKGSYSDQVATGIDLFSYREPLGVVAGITPFNFPVMVPCWMFPLAIACGNTFVLKPSERDPTASMRLAELFADAGLPEGVFNVVHGDKTAVDALLDHADIAAVSFVGSTPIARYVHARGTAAGKRVQAFGGAKNHAVILPDAQPELASAQVASAAFGSAGERCMAISASISVGGSGAAFVEQLCERAAAIRVGPGRDPASEMGATGHARGSRARHELDRCRRRPGLSRSPRRSRR